MLAIKELQQSTKNRLLAALPTQEYERLIPYLELVSLPLRQVIYESGEPIKYVYFPNNAIVSLVSTMSDGATVEVGVVGNEGMVGVPVFLGGDSTLNQAFVQFAGDGMRIEAHRLKAEFNRGGVLQSLLLRYTQALLTQASQTAACNRLHTVEERFARWLLVFADRIQSDQFPLTQEFVSQMLASRRAGVSVVAGTLQQAGIIRYTRGKITILNREALEDTSCECYGLVKAEFSRLIGAEYA